MTGVDDRIEINLGDAVLILDHNVVELFLRPSTSSKRWHVSHVNVDAKPARKGGGMKYVIGIRINDVMMDSMPIDVPASAQDSVEALFREAMLRRDAAATTVI